jgi:universal stress protein A
MPRRTIPIATAPQQAGLHLHTILVPCDFSASSEHALRWAGGFAEEWDAKLVVLHVISVFFPMDSVPARLLAELPPVLPQLESARFSATTTRLEEYTTRNAKSPVAVDLRVVVGDAWWEICRAAEREAADLIVLGSHGHTDRAAVALGSVAQRVVRHAPCPVLVIRVPDQAAPERETAVVP